MNATTDPVAAWRDRLAVQELVQRTAQLLDAEDLEPWAGLFHPDGRYRIGAHSTELGRDLFWWDEDLAALRRTLSEVKQHVRDPACRRRVLGPALVHVDGDRATAESAFSVYRTSTDGQSSLYVVGRYLDELARVDGQWRYTLHHAALDTRVMDAFTHLPL